MNDLRINRETAGRKADCRWWNSILVVSLIAGTALRIYSILYESAMGDELFCRRLTMLSWNKNLQAVAGDVVTPPVNYLAYKAWSGLAGHGLLELRFLALLFSVAVIIGTVLLGRYIFRDRRVAVLAGVLVAGNDMQILFSHFARHYALYSVMVLALIAVFWRAFRNPRDWAAWIWFSGLATILVYTHYIGWLYLFGLFLIILTRHFRMLWKRFLISVSVPAMLFLPWLFLVIPHYGDRRGLRAALSWMTNPSVSVFPDLFARFSGLPGIYNGWLMVLAGGIFIVVIAGLLYGKQSFSNRSYPRQQALVLLAGAAILPPLLLFFLARPPLELPIWGFRHLLPSQAIWALLTALGIISIARQKKLAFTLCAIIAVSLQWLPSIRSTVQLRFFPLSDVISYLRQERSETENIYTFSAAGRLGPIRYYLGAAGAVKSLPENISELPVSFWGIYDPGSESDRKKMVLLEKLGYTSRQAELFTHPAYFRRHHDDLWELRIVHLSNNHREGSFLFVPAIRQYAPGLPDEF